MRNDYNITIALLTISLLFSGGCASLGKVFKRERRIVRYEPVTYRVIPIRDSRNPEIIYYSIAIREETYFDILNRELRAKAPIIIETRRHIGFGYSATEKEQRAFIKIVFPWPGMNGENNVHIQETSR